LAQIRGYMTAIERAEKRRLLNDLTIARAAMADDKSFNRIIKELEAGNEQLQGK
jgi:hypothetical protein